MLRMPTFLILLQKLVRKDNLYSSFSCCYLKFHKHLCYKKNTLFLQNSFLIFIFYSQWSSLHFLASRSLLHFLTSDFFLYPQSQQPCISLIILQQSYLPLTTLFFCLSLPLLRILVITLGPLNNLGYLPYYKMNRLATLILSHSFWLHNIPYSPVPRIRAWTFWKVHYSASCST